MTKPDEVKVSAKVLGALAMPDACPRCFWIKHYCKVPFQIFPGIFNSIDAYTKKVVHANFDKYGKPPTWLPSLKGTLRYLKVPHWSKFKRLDPKTGITISGAMDDLFEHNNGSLIIPDYKTAKFTPTQDKLLPMYEAQLNNYSWIMESLSDRPVGALYLIYCEPITSAPEQFKGSENWPLFKYTEDGFNMEFIAKELLVKQDPHMTRVLLDKAKTIIELVEPPVSLDGCEDCVKVNELQKIVAPIPY